MVLAIHHPNDLKGKDKLIGGSMSDGWNDAIAGQVINSLWTKHLDDDEANKLRAAAVEALIGIKPQDEIEGMIAAQLIACHNASMECYRRAMLPDNSFDMRHGNLNSANKLSRTYATLARKPQSPPWQRASRRSRSSTSTFTKAAKPSSATSRARGVGSHRNQRNNPMQALHMHQGKRCRARTRRGSPCQSPAMKNGRCRMHGGTSPGAPKGNKNALKHGRYTAEAIARRREIAELIRTARELIGVA